MCSLALSKGVYIVVEQGGEGIMHFSIFPHKKNYNFSAPVLLNVHISRVEILLLIYIIQTELQACGSIGLPMQSMPNYTVQFISKERMLELKNMTGIGLSYGQGIKFILSSFRHVIHK